MRKLKGDGFFLQPGNAFGAGILSAVTGVEYNGMVVFPEENRFAPGWDDGND